MRLSVNQLIRWNCDPDAPDSASIERIIFIDETGNDVAAIEVDRKKAKPVWYKYQELKTSIKESEAIILDVDHCAPLSLTVTDLENPKYMEIKRKRDNRWEVIAPLVTGENAFKILFPHERAALIAERTKVTFPHGKNGKCISYSRQSIYSFIYLWWRGGQTKNTLLGRSLNCGAMGKKRVQKERKIGRPSKITATTGQATGVVLTAFWMNIIIWGALLFYKNQKIKDMQAAYRKTLRYFCSKGKKLNEKGEWELILPDYTKGEIFSPNQFKYHVLKKLNENLEDFFRKKYGARKVNLRYRALKGNSTQLAPYPGALYQIDATIADVYLVSRLNRTHIIGRPVIVVIIDVFSRMIVGVSIRMEREGWNVINIALKNATEDKVAFCQKYGIEISPKDWPVIGLCDSITGDRGPMIGYNADNLVEGLNIIVSNLPPYRADWKGIIERMFRHMNVLIIKNLPGALEAPKERGDRDVRLDAVLDINQFTGIIIKAILYHNNHYYMDSYPLDKDMIAADVKPIPRDLFLWGRKNRSGRPRYRSAESIRIHLLPSSNAKVTSRGIKFKNEYYTCQKAEVENWRFIARNKGAWSVKVAYDPRVPEIIYLCPDDGSASIPCHLMNRDSIFVDSDLAEIEEYYERKSIEDQRCKVLDMHERSNLEDYTEGVADTAEGLAARAFAIITPESKQSRLSNTNKHRQAEVELMDGEYRQEILEQAGLLRASNSVDPEAETDSGDEYVQRPKLPNVLSIQERMMQPNGKEQ